MPCMAIQIAWIMSLLCWRGVSLCIIMEKYVGSAADLHQHITDLTECSICKETMSSPKILPCIHTFCLRCLEGSYQDNLPGDMIACSLCRTEFAIPEGGLSGLPNNFFLDKLADINRISSLLPGKKISCDICNEDDGNAFSDNVYAQMFCIDCRQHMCSQCSQHHEKISSSSGHSVVKHGSQPNADEVTKFQASYCQDHRSEIIKLFCSECRLGVCLVCYVENHSGHKCLDISKAADGFKQELQSDFIDQIDGCIRLMYQKLASAWEEQKCCFLRQIETIESDINRRGEELKAIIENHVDTLLKELHSIKTTRLMEID